MNTNKAGIIIIDDHQLVCEALAVLIDSQVDMEMLFHATGVNDGLKLLSASDRQPDIALIDISVPELNGLALIKRFSRPAYRLKSVVITCNTEVDTIAQALYCGADGYICKQSGSSVLLEGLRAVMDGKTFIDPGLKEILFDNI